jgi:hypothetical protein
MNTLLKKFFIDHWPRKCIALCLAIVIWFVINHSMTTTKTIANIPVKIMNIPYGKTVEGLQSNGMLAKRITLTIAGNKTLLDDLTPNDLEVVIDAAGKQDQWIATLTKKNLVSLNPDIDLSKGIGKISHQSFLVRMTRMISEKIPIVITQPVGEAPRGYQFLDVWPYHMTLTVSGPEEVVKKLKAKGPKKLTFNLNDITKGQLDSLLVNSVSAKRDEVSFYVPDSWKSVNLPLISDTPIEIDDPQSKALRIDFVRCSLLPVHKPIPVNLFFPPEYSDKLNPETCQLAMDGLIHKMNGLGMIKEPLYAKGASRLFLEIVQDMIQINVIVVPKTERQYLEWSIQFTNPSILENRYIAARLADGSNDESKDLSPNLREEYLRNQFRSYMNYFQLYKSNDTKFVLQSELQGNYVMVSEGK